MRWAVLAQGVHHRMLWMAAVALKPRLLMWCCPWCCWQQLQACETGVRCCFGCCVLWALHTAPCVMGWCAAQGSI